MDQDIFEIVFFFTRIAGFQGDFCANHTTLLVPYVGFSMAGAIAKFDL